MKKIGGIGGLIVILVFICSFINTSLYVYNSANITLENTWGPCSVAFPDKASEKKCWNDFHKSINNSKAYINNFSDIAKILAIAFIIISIITAIVVPKVVYKVISVLSILSSVFLLFVMLGG